MAEQQYYNKDKVHGFYYDHQMMNPLYTVTLHPNTRARAPQDNDFDWSNDLVNKKDAFEIEHFDTKWEEFLTNGYSGASSGTNGGYLPGIDPFKPWSKYYAEPICSSIFSEDFMFSLNNEWSSWDGGNAIENLFKTAKPYAPMMTSLAQGLKGAEKSMEGLNGFGASAVQAMTNLAGTAGDAFNKAGNKLNKALYIQGTRYSMYNGTSTHFGNMSMKFTVLSDWVQDWPSPNGDAPWRFSTVYDKIRRIFPYALGFYRPERGGLGWLWEEIKVKKEISEPIDKFIAEYAGWQSPPGGYEASTKNINNVQKGTLRLVLGGYYTIDNLVIKNWTVNMSRQLCKNPDKPEEMVPLYADIQIDLAPAGVYTDAKLDQFINQGGMKEIIKAMTPPQVENNGTGETDKNSKNK